MEFSYFPDDIIYISNAASLYSMVYYSEHKEEAACPCKYKRIKAKVLFQKGNYVYVEPETDIGVVTVFHIRDISLIQRSTMES